MFPFMVRMATEKSNEKVFSSAGTPQWTVPLKKFLELSGPKSLQNQKVCVEREEGEKKEDWKNES